MVRLRWAIVAVCGCYHPSGELGVPCSPLGTCPDQQVCDTSQSPATCTGALIDASSPHTDAPSDSRSVSDAAADAVMAALPIKFVQVKTFKPTAAVTTLPFDAPVSAHDAIIVCLNFPISSGATLLSIADAAANDSYDVVVPAIDSGGTRHYVAIAQDVSASASAVTVTLSAPTVSGSDMFAIEYSGIATNNAFDVSANASGATAAMASGDATTTYANELDPRLCRGLIGDRRERLRDARDALGKHGRGYGRRRHRLVRGDREHGRNRHVDDDHGDIQRSVSRTESRVAATDPIDGPSYRTSKPWPTRP